MAGTRNASVTITAGTAPQLVSEASPNRQMLFILNTSTSGQIIALGFDQDGTQGAGIILNPGDHWLEYDDGDFSCFKGRVFANSSASSGVVSIHERFA